MERTWPPLEFQVTVPVSRPAAWRAFTDPAVLTRWLARDASLVPDESSYCLTWPQAALECRVLLRTQERVLRLTWPDAARVLPETMVVVLFHARGASTLVELEHYGFGRGRDWDEHYVSCARAWTGYLKNLRSVLSQGLDLREEDE